MLSQGEITLKNKLYSLIALAGICFSISGCASVAGMIDPNYAEFSCTDKSGKGIPCTDIETVAQITEDNNHKSAGQIYTPAPPSSPTPYQTSDLGTGIGIGTGMLYGAAGGAAIGAAFAPDGNELKNGLIGAGVGAASGGLLAYLIDKSGGESKVGEKEKKRLIEVINKYEKCLSKAANEKDSLAALQHCSDILADVPGMSGYKAAGIAGLLKAQRETDIKKTFKMDNGSMPLRVPPKIIKIFITAYVDDKDMFIPGHALFSHVDEGKWILPSQEDTSSIKILRPLGK